MIMAKRLEGEVFEERAILKIGKNESQKKKEARKK